MGYKLKVLGVGAELQRDVGAGGEQTNLGSPARMYLVVFNIQIYLGEADINTLKATLEDEASLTADKLRVLRRLSAMPVTRQVLESATELLRRELSEWRSVYDAAIARAARPDFRSTALAAVTFSQRFEEAAQVEAFPTSRCSCTSGHPRLSVAVADDKTHVSPRPKKQGSQTPF